MRVFLIKFRSESFLLSLLPVIASYQVENCAVTALSFEPAVLRGLVLQVQFLTFWPMITIDTLNEE